MFTRTSETPTIGTYPCNNRLFFFLPVAFTKINNMQLWNEVNFLSPLHCFPFSANPCWGKALHKHPVSSRLSTSFLSYPHRISGNLSFLQEVTVTPYTSPDSPLAVTFLWQYNAFSIYLTICWQTVEFHMGKWFLSISCSVINTMLEYLFLQIILKTIQFS